jgi:hypothetical protein
MMTRKEALTNTQKILTQNEFDPEDLEAVQWIEEIIANRMGLNKLINAWVDELCDYTIHIILLENEEKFEMCNQIKKAIDITTNNLAEVLIQYFNTNEEIIEEIKEIPAMLYNNLKENEEEWINDLMK